MGGRKGTGEIFTIFEPSLTSDFVNKVTLREDNEQLWVISVAYYVFEDVI